METKLADIVKNVATNKWDVKIQPHCPLSLENPNMDTISIPGVGSFPRFHVGVTKYFFPWLCELIEENGERLPADISTEQLVWGKKCAGPTGPSPISWNIADQTKELGCSFIMWCLINGYSRDNKGCPLFSPVTTFVSHAWKGTFQSLHDSIKLKSQINGDLGASILPAYFLDIFVVNQHTPPWREQPFVGMDVALRQPIELSHKTLLVMSPFEDPVPLKRAWCIYEICNTKRLGAVLDITMPAQEHERFIAALTRGDFDFNDWVAHIDIEAAGAFDPSDKQMIMALVQATPGAAAGLNRTVVEVLCEWLGQQGYLALQSLPEKDRGTSKLIKNLANVLWRQGKPDEAEVLYKQMVECRREAFGNADPFTLDGLHIWGRFLRVKGDFEEAKKILQETVAGREAVLGPDDPDTLTSQMELAEVLRHMSLSPTDLAGVEEVMAKVLISWRKWFAAMDKDETGDLKELKKFTKAALREMRINFLESLKVHAAIMMQRKVAAPALICATMEECLAGRMELFGPRNPATLDVVVLQTQYNLSQNNVMDDATVSRMTTALEILRGTLGDRHPRTLNCICIFSQVMRSLVEANPQIQEQIANGAADLSLVLINEAVQGYESTLGFDHPATQWARCLQQGRNADIQRYMDYYTSCYSPCARVLMADGVTTKYARDIQIGDRVATPVGNGVTTVIGHTIQLQGQSRALILLEDGLRISRMHRVQSNGQWIRPENYPGATKIYEASELHNFAVENCDPIVVNGIVVATLGTYCEGTHDCLVKPNHRLWASPHIVDIFKQHPSWPVVVLNDDDLFLRAIKNKSFALDYLTTLPVRAEPLLTKYGWHPDNFENGTNLEKGLFTTISWSFNSSPVCD